MHQPLWSYPFRSHALIHHGIFRTGPSYFLSRDEDLIEGKVRFAWWNAPLIIGLHAPVVLWIQHLLRMNVFFGAMAALGLYYFLYEYLHFCMHVPKGRWIETTAWFRWLDTHHHMHHKRHLKNLNVVLPLADLVFGTLVPPGQRIAAPERPGRPVDWHTRPVSHRLMISRSDPCRRLSIAWLGIASPLLLIAACSVPATRAKAPAVPAPGRGASQTGIASWYGPGFHGRTTASGAIYDQDELTAAHQTLPLGTRIMVTNLDNGRSTEATVNDRGPFAKGRILDLSYAAAKTLGMIGPGTVPVRLEVIDSGLQRISTIPKSLDYTLQLGAFTELGNAHRLKEELARSYPELSHASIVSFQGREAVYYRVQVGTYSDHREAERHARRLAQLGLAVIIREK